MTFLYICGCVLGFPACSLGLSVSSSAVLREAASMENLSVVQLLFYLLAGGALQGWAQPWRRAECELLVVKTTGES